jgi:hypothetical protein
MYAEACRGAGRKEIVMWLIKAVIGLIGGIFGLVVGLVGGALGLVAGLLGTVFGLGVAALVCVGLLFAPLILLLILIF